MWDHMHLLNNMTSIIIPSNVKYRSYGFSNTVNNNRADVIIVNPDNIALGNTFREH